MPACVSEKEIYVKVRGSTAPIAEVIDQCHLIFGGIYTIIFNNQGWAEPIKSQVVWTHKVNLEHACPQRPLAETGINKLTLLIGHIVLIVVHITG